MTEDECDLADDEAFELLCLPIMDEIVMALNRLGWKIVCQCDDRLWTTNEYYDDHPTWTETPPPRNNNVVMLRP